MGKGKSGKNRESGKNETGLRRLRDRKAEAALRSKGRGGSAIKRLRRSCEQKAEAVLRAKGRGGSAVLYLRPARVRRQAKEYIARVVS